MGWLTGIFSARRETLAALPKTANSDLGRNDNCSERHRTDA